MDLNTIWFILIFVLFSGYAILDGFDFGVGILHLFTGDNRERRMMMNAIGPVWDGNEVWLLTGGGALFAAFPIVYATALSAMYHAVMLILFALIFRAVSMEFRGKVDSSSWRKFWDWAFGLGSLLPPFLFGIALGNVLHGLPLDDSSNFTGSFFSLLNPYALLVGVLTIVLFTMHGALYMTMKVNGKFRERMFRWASSTWIVFVVLYLVTTFVTIFAAPFLFDKILKNALFWILLLVLLLGFLYIPLATKARKAWQAFFSSSVCIIAMLGLAAVSLFPRMAPSNIDLDYSLTIYNASSSQKTLMIMLIIALIGMPLVIAYTWYIYHVFKGKIK